MVWIKLIFQKIIWVHKFLICYLVEKEQLDNHVFDYTFLHSSIQWNNNDIDKLLIESGANVNIKDKDVRSQFIPLHISIRNNNIDIDRLLIENDAKVNIQNFDGDTSLHISIMVQKKGLKIRVGGL